MNYREKHLKLWEELFKYPSKSKGNVFTEQEWKAVCNLCFPCEYTVRNVAMDDPEREPDCSLCPLYGRWPDVDGNYILWF